MAKRIQFSEEQESRLRDPTQSHDQLAREFGCSSMPIRRWRQENGVEVEKTAPLANPLGTPGRIDSDDESIVTSAPVLANLVSEAGGSEKYLRTTWNLPEEDWYCTTCTGNQWEGPQSGGAVVIYAQVKGTFRPTKALSDLIPAAGVWQGPQYSSKPLKEGKRPHTVIVLGDHQAPYHDEVLHEATLTLIEELKPSRIVHLGDLCDYTNISKFRDHALVRADVDECTQAGVNILASIRHSAPDAQIQILPGNHDLRPLNELLARAERVAGIRCGDLHDSAGRELISLEALWRLDELGIELCSDPRGWEHTQVELIPGASGLIVIHGFLTGKNVASRTLAKVGKSVIMGHTHRPEHVFEYSHTLGLEQQAVVVGCQCIVRGQSRFFPTFAANDEWLQGPAVVTIYPGGEFSIERARWNGSELFAAGLRI